MSNVLVNPPSVYIVQLLFDGVNGGYPIAGTGLIDNYPVKLPFPCKRVAKINTNQATTWPDNNIFLHWQPFTDSLGTGNLATGRLVQLGAMPNVFPLEFGVQSKQNRGYRFACGIPTQCFLSADFQGTGTHIDSIAFFNDDVDIDIYPFTGA